MDLNEKTLEEILSRQRREYEQRLAKTEERVDVALARSEDRMEAAIIKQGEQYERRMGVLVESLQTKIEIVGEVVSGIQQELREVREMTERNTAAIERLEVGQIVLRDEIRDGLAKKADRTELRSLEARVERLEARQ